MNVLDFVTKTKQKYNDIRDIEYVAETENILLLYMDISNNIDGFTLSLNDTLAIVIKKGLLTCRQVEIFWHEYYHLYFSVGNYETAKLFLKSPMPFDRRDEKKADAFVALLLIDKLPAECDVYTVMDEFNVSQHIAEVRMTLFYLDFRE